MAARSVNLLLTAALVAVTAEARLVSSTTRFNLNHPVGERRAKAPPFIFIVYSSATNNHATRLPSSSNPSIPTVPTASGGDHSNHSQIRSETWIKVSTFISASNQSEYQTTIHTKRNRTTVTKSELNGNQTVNSTWIQVTSSDTNSDELQEETSSPIWSYSGLTTRSNSEDVVLTRSDSDDVPTRPDSDHVSVSIGTTMHSHSPQLTSKGKSSTTTSELLRTGSSPISTRHPTHPTNQAHISDGSVKETIGLLSTHHMHLTELQNDLISHSDVHPITSATTSTRHAANSTAHNSGSNTHHSGKETSKTSHILTTAVESSTSAAKTQTNGNGNISATTSHVTKNASKEYSDSSGKLTHSTPFIGKSTTLPMGDLGSHESEYLSSSSKPSELVNSSITQADGHWSVSSSYSTHTARQPSNLTSGLIRNTTASYFGGSGHTLKLTTHFNGVTNGSTQSIISSSKGDGHEGSTFKEQLTSSWDIDHINLSNSSTPSSTPEMDSTMSAIQTEISKSDGVVTAATLFTRNLTEFMVNKSSSSSALPSSTDVTTMRSTNHSKRPMAAGSTELSGETSSKGRGSTKPVSRPINATKTTTAQSKSSALSQHSTFGSTTKTSSATKGSTRGTSISSPTTRKSRPTFSSGVPQTNHTKKPTRYTKLSATETKVTGHSASSDSHFQNIVTLSTAGTMFSGSVTKETVNTTKPDGVSVVSNALEGTVVPPYNHSEGLMVTSSSYLSSTSVNLVTSSTISYEDTSSKRPSRGNFHSTVGLSSVAASTQRPNDEMSVFIQPIAADSSDDGEVPWTRPKNSRCYIWWSCGAHYAHLDNGSEGRM